MLVNINRIKVNVKEAAAWYNLQVPQSNFQLAFVFGSLHYQISSQMTTLQKLDLNSEGSQIMSTLTTTRMHHKAGAHLLWAGAPTVAFNPKPKSSLSHQGLLQRGGSLKTMTAWQTSPPLVSSAAVSLQERG